MNNNDVIHRLKSAMKAIGLKPSELARRCNVSRAYISQILNGTSEPRLRRILPAISDKVNADWIISGRGNMLVSDDIDAYQNEDLSIAFKILDIIKEDRSNKSKTAANSENIRIPVFEEDSSFEKEEEYISIPQELLKPVTGKYFAYRMISRSISPRLEPNDIAVFRQQGMLENGQIGAFSIPDCNTYKSIIRAFEHKEDHIILMSTDPYSSPIILLPDDEVHILGLLLLAIRYFS